MGLTGLRRVDHIGFTVPDLEQARAFLVDVLGCEYLYSLGPFVHDDSDWMADHLAVHPRAVMRRNSFFRCGDGTVFEVFSYEAPDQRTAPPRNSDIGGHHVALYVDDLDAAVEELRALGVRVLAGPTASRGANEGQRWIYFLSPWGMQFELVSYPGGKAFDRDPGAFRVNELAEAGEVGVGAASARVADYLRTAILDGEIVPGEWIRQEEVAERLGSSRLPVREALRILEAEGLTEHEPRRGARVPSLSMHEVDVVYRMREQLEQLAIAESIPNLGADDVRALEAVQDRIEALPPDGDDAVADFLRLDREFHLRSYTGCRIDQLTSSVTRLWNSTAHYRRSFVTLSGPGRRWVIEAEHRLLLDAVARADVVDAQRFVAGHIRRTRIELGRHPEIFQEGPA